MFPLRVQNNGLNPYDQEENKFSQPRNKEVIITKSLADYMVYETGSSIPHSQGLSNNPYPNTNQPNSSFKYHVFAPMGRFQLELIYFIFHRLSNK